MSAPVLTLDATPIRVASDTVLEAMEILTPPANAPDGALVGVARDFRKVDASTLPDSLKTALWTREGSRWLERKVAKLDQEIAPRAALLYALLSEDDQALVPVIVAQEEWPETDEKFAGIRLLLVRGGAIVYRLRPDLALFEREDAEAQDFLQDNLSVFIDERLSRHQQVEALRALSAAATDIATNGTVERHLGGADGAPPIRHQVVVRTQPSSRS